jgi:hypothetical protein
VDWLLQLGPALTYISGVCTTAALAVWRLAVWTNTVTKRLDAHDAARKAERDLIARQLKAEREEHDRQHAAVLDKLSGMSAASQDRHALTLRELDQIRADAQRLASRVDALAR